MPADLLARISAEIEERQSKLRAAVDEYQRLLGAADALDAQRARGRAGAPSHDQRVRGRAAAADRDQRARGRAAAADRDQRARGRAAAADRDQRARGRARRVSPQQQATAHAIVAALEHGSHTVGELVLVSAIPVADIREGVRRLRAAGAIAPVERDGRTAYALSASAG